MERERFVNISTNKYSVLYCIESGQHLFLEVPCIICTTNPLGKKEKVFEDDLRKKFGLLRLYFPYQHTQKLNLQINNRGLVDPQEKRP